MSQNGLNIGIPATKGPNSARKFRGARRNIMMVCRNDESLFSEQIGDGYEYASREKS